MIHLFRTVLPVSDMDRGDAFWSGLLGLEVDAVSPTRHYLPTEGCILALVDPSRYKRAHRPWPDVVYFRVPDLDATFEAARVAGTRPLLEGDVGEGIRERPWEERSFYGVDPFGNPFCCIDDRSSPSPSTVRYSGNPIPHLCKVILPVKDLRSADAFWGTLLGLEVDRSVENRHFLYCQGCCLALVDPSEHARMHGLTPAPFQTNPEIVYFGVDGLDETYKRARELGATEMGGNLGDGIRIRPWKERSFYALDPSGNPFCVVDRLTLYTGSSGSPSHVGP